MCLVWHNVTIPDQPNAPTWQEILDIVVAPAGLELSDGQNMDCAAITSVKQYEIVSIRPSGLTMCGRYMQETHLVAGRHCHARLSKNQRNLHGCHHFEKDRPALSNKTRSSVKVLDLFRQSLPICAIQRSQRGSGSFSQPC